MGTKGGVAFGWLHGMRAAVSPPAKKGGKQEVDDKTCTKMVNTVPVVEKARPCTHPANHKIETETKHVAVKAWRRDEKLTQASG